MENRNYVYCGPSVKGLVRQYTVFANGLPGPLKEYCKTHPEAKALLAPVGEFAEMRKRLETPGTREALLYGKLRNGL